jgi:hypothetical protein
VTLEKNRAPCFLKKAGSKKQVHCYSKRKEAAWSFLFLNNNDPGFFATFFFQVHMLDLIFSGSQTDPFSKQE